MQGSPLSICPALNILWNDMRLHCLDRQRSTLLYRAEKRSFHDMLRATPNARVPRLARLPPFCPALNISWNDLRLHCLDRQRSTLLYRDEKRSFHDIVKGDSECKGPPLPFGRLRMQGSPLSICPALNISWNDLRLHCLDRQRSTLLYRDEKRSFHDMLRATPNARVPLAIWATPNARLPPFNFSRP